MSCTACGGGRSRAPRAAPNTPTATASSLYDGEGQRAQQVVTSGATATTTTYVGGLEELATTGATTTTTAYYGGLALSVNGGLALSVNGALSYTLADGLGSMSEAVNTASVVTGARLYGPYGSVRYTSGSMPGTKGFTGQHADATTGLDYYGARYYDPLAGQFTSADRTFAGGLNLYAYVAGNPETRTDPTGHRYAQPHDYQPGLAAALDAYYHITQYHEDVYFGNVQGMVSSMLQVDTIRQSFHTVFQDPHANLGDRARAAGVGTIALLGDAVTILSLFAGQPEAAEGVQAAEGAIDGALLAGDAATATDAAAVTTEGVDATAATTAATTEAATAGGNDYVQFAHGTSLEYAQTIESGGLNADVARAASKGGLYSKPGSFFTFNLTEHGQPAFQAAYEFGFRQASDKMPVVLKGRLPRSLYDELVSGGGVSVSDIPKVAFPETAFSPETFDQLNASMEWDIIDPYQPVR